MSLNYCLLGALWRGFAAVQPAVRNGCIAKAKGLAPPLLVVTRFPKGCERAAVVLGVVHVEQHGRRGHRRFGNILGMGTQKSPESLAVVPPQRFPRCQAALPCESGIQSILLSRQNSGG